MLYILVVAGVWTLMLYIFVVAEVWTLTLYMLYIVLTNRAKFTRR